MTTESTTRKLIAVLSADAVGYSRLMAEDEVTTVQRLKSYRELISMYKVADYNPDAGDWFWAKYSPDGKVDKFGKPEGCVGCHGTRAKNDFILVHEFE